MRDVAAGMTRFDQFRLNLGIAPNILTRRLRSLTAAGVLAKRRYSHRPPRDEYVLTDAGKEFLPVLHVIAEWGRRRASEAEVSRLIDMQTGKFVEPVVVDSLTGRPLSDLEVRLVSPASQAEADR